MTNVSKFALIALAGALATAGAISKAEAKKGNHEKCFGVTKAGSNDCGTSSHSCAGQAAENNDKSEWVYVPKGLCDKLAGGNLESK